MPSAALKFLAFTACNTALLLGGCDALPGSSSASQDYSALTEIEKTQVTDVIDDVNAFWKRTFQESGKTYQQPDIVFTKAGTCRSIGCYTSLSNGSDTPDALLILKPDVASKPLWKMAVIIAHEIGHHVENSDTITNNPSDSGVVNELQATCLAGMWARQTQLLTETTRNTIANSLKGSHGHGTAEQNRQAFRTGLKAQKMSDCNAKAVLGKTR